MSKKAALVLAAGKGTRMHSDRPKVLQTVLGEPMLAFVLAALEPEFGEDVFIAPDTPCARPCPRSGPRAPIPFSSSTGMRPW